MSQTRCAEDRLATLEAEVAQIKNLRDVSAGHGPSGDPPRSRAAEVPAIAGTHRPASMDGVLRFDRQLRAFTAMQILTTHNYPINNYATDEHRLNTEEEKPERRTQPPEAQNDSKKNWTNSRRSKNPKRWGLLPEHVQQQIRGLTFGQLAALGEALLDFRRRKISRIGWTRMSRAKTDRKPRTRVREPQRTRRTPGAAQKQCKMTNDQ